MTFLSPERLWLLALAPILVGLYIVLQMRRRNYAVRFTNLALLSQVAPKRPGWRRHVAAGLFLIMIVLMMIGFARPASSVKVPRDRATIMVAVDVSPLVVAIVIGNTPSCVGHDSLVDDAARQFVSAG